LLEHPTALRRYFGPASELRGEVIASWAVAVTTNPMQAAPPLVYPSSLSEHRFSAQAGSSFILDSDAPQQLIVTAAHVVTAAAGVALAAALYPPGGSGRMLLAAVTRWHVRNDFDVAVGLLDGEPRPGLAILGADTPLIMNRDVYAIEHSRSINPDPNTPGMSTLSPLIRKGNIIQAREGLHPHHPSTSMLELSFPALKGASGAPVVQDSGGQVVGMVVANVERELMPAQVLTAFRDDGTPLEEVRYFMPNALAVNRVHLVEVIAEARAAFGA
jgi:S1-C subfamily serine protease